MQVQALQNESQLAGIHAKIIRAITAGFFAVKVIFNPLSSKDYVITYDKKTFALYAHSLPHDNCMCRDCRSSSIRHLQ